MDHRSESTTPKPPTEIMEHNELLSRRRLYLWGGLALGLLVLIIGLIWAFQCRDILVEKVCYYYDAFTDKDRIKQFLEAMGPLAPLLFVGVQILQVVFAPIPGEATGFIGGFLFGVPLGMLYSTIGLTIGSVLAFLLAAGCRSTSWPGSLAPRP